MSCWLVPSAKEGFAGVMAIETSNGGPTVSPAEPVMEFSVAEIVAWPAVTPEARPVALIVAVPGADELQLTDALTSCVLPSVKVPMASNCWVVPEARVVPEGETVINERAGGPTESDAVPVTPAKVARIVVAPSLRLVARPPAPIAATPAGEVDQLTDEVRFCVLPSV